jgi:hypothetical protein
VTSVRFGRHRREVNKTEQNGATALYVASQVGHVEVVLARQDVEVKRPRRTRFFLVFLLYEDCCCCCYSLSRSWCAASPAALLPLCSCAAASSGRALARARLAGCEGGLERALRRRRVRALGAARRAPGRRAAQLRGRGSRPVRARRRLSEGNG